MSKNKDFSPSEGDRYINSKTGQEYFYQSGKWIEQQPVTIELLLTERLYHDREPCSLTCANHISHPCDRCGRVAARGEASVPVDNAEEHPHSKQIKKSKDTRAFWPDEEHPATTTDDVRKEWCRFCCKYVSDWVDPDWAKGRVCRDCETKYGPPEPDEIVEEGLTDDELKLIEGWNRLAAADYLPSFESRLYKDIASVVSKLRARAASLQTDKEHDPPLSGMSAYVRGYNKRIGRTKYVEELKQKVKQLQQKLDLETQKNHGS